MNIQKAMKGWKLEPVINEDGTPITLEKLIVSQKSNIERARKTAANPNDVGYKNRLARQYTTWLSANGIKTQPDGYRKDTVSYMKTTPDEGWLPLLSKIMDHKEDLLEAFADWNVRLLGNEEAVIRSKPVLNSCAIEYFLDLQYGRGNVNVKASNREKVSNLVWGDLKTWLPYLSCKGKYARTLTALIEYCGEDEECLSVLRSSQEKSVLERLNRMLCKDYVDPERDFRRLVTRWILEPYDPKDYAFIDNFSHYKNSNLSTEEWGRLVLDILTETTRNEKRRFNAIFKMAAENNVILEKSYLTIEDVRRQASVPLPIYVEDVIDGSDTFRSHVEGIADHYRQLAAEQGGLAVVMYAALLSLLPSRLGPSRSKLPGDVMERVVDDLNTVLGYGNDVWASADGCRFYDCLWAAPDDTQTAANVEFKYGKNTVSHAKMTYGRLEAEDAGEAIKMMANVMVLQSFLSYYNVIQWLAHDKSNVKIFIDQVGKAFRLSIKNEMKTVKDRRKRQKKFRYPVLNPNYDEFERVLGQDGLPGYMAGGVLPRFTTWFSADVSKSGPGYLLKTRVK